MNKKEKLIDKIKNRGLYDYIFQYYKSPKLYDIKHNINGVEILEFEKDIFVLKEQTNLNLEELILYDNVIKLIKSKTTKNIFLFLIAYDYNYNITSSAPTIYKKLLNMTGIYIIKKDLYMCKIYNRIHTNIYWKHEIQILKNIKKEIQTKYKINEILNTHNVINLEYTESTIYNLLCKYHIITTEFVYLCPQCYNTTNSYKYGIELFETENDICEICDNHMTIGLVYKRIR